jgi:hypothetical protein
MADAEDLQHAPRRIGPALLQDGEPAGLGHDLGEEVRRAKPARQLRFRSRLRPAGDDRRDHVGPRPAAEHGCNGFHLRSTDHVRTPFSIKLCY